MFSTGEFSKLSRVSKRLLHYYDEIGLFKPAHIDAFTKYRYYSAHQLPQLNRILALKDLGFNLDEIQRMVADQVSDEEIKGMLILKKSESEKAIADEQQRLRRIEARLADAGESSNEAEVVLKSIPSQRFLSLRTVVEKPEDAMGLVGLLMQAVPQRLGPSIIGPFAAVVYTEEFKLEDNDIQVGYYLKKKHPKPLVVTEEVILTEQELPAVEHMATAVQVGGADLVFQALGKIAQWIEVNGYKMAGPYREIVLDMQGEGALGNSVIEIQLPVDKK